VWDRSRVYLSFSDFFLFSFSFSFPKKANLCALDLLLENDTLGTTHFFGWPAGTLVHGLMSHPLAFGFRQQNQHPYHQIGLQSKEPSKQPIAWSPWVSRVSDLLGLNVLSFSKSVPKSLSIARKYF
jgi:hypothetical protein